jgi:hypothetical protein
VEGGDLEANDVAVIACSFGQEFQWIAPRIEEAAEEKRTARPRSPLER